MSQPGGEAPTSHDDQHGGDDKFDDETREGARDGDKERHIDGAHRDDQRRNDRKKRQAARKECWRDRDVLSHEESAEIVAQRDRDDGEAGAQREDGEETQKVAEEGRFAAKVQRVDGENVTWSEAEEGCCVEHKVEEQHKRKIAQEEREDAALALHGGDE
jgi:hypothetical protein